MHATLQWHTQAGTITADNRDTCAHIEPAHASLYPVSYTHLTLPTKA